MKDFNLLDKRAEYVLNYSLGDHIDTINKITNKDSCVDMIQKLPLNYAFNIELIFDVYLRVEGLDIAKYECIEYLKRDVLKNACIKENVKTATVDIIQSFAKSVSYLKQIPHDIIKMEFYLNGKKHRIVLKKCSMSELYSLAVFLMNIDENIFISSSYGVIFEPEKIMGYFNLYTKKYFIVTKKGKYFFNSNEFIRYLKKFYLSLGYEDGGENSFWNLYEN